MRKLLLFIIVFINIIIPAFLLAQNDADKEDFYFDAIVFYDNEIDSARLDIYVVIPNERLSFISSDNGFAASFELNVTLTNTETNTTTSLLKDIRSVFTTDYMAAQGGSGELTLISQQNYIPVGNYRIRAILNDKISDTEYEKGRVISVIDFSNFNFVASSLMLVSNIEESADDFLITPYISDNVGNLNDGYFAFFEVYNDRSDVKNVDILVEIIDNESEQVVYSDTINKAILEGTNQLYVHIPAKINYGAKSNTLRVYLYNSDNSLASFDVKPEPLAAAQRSIRSISFIRNRIANNLSLSIRQLIYVATSKQIDTIESGADDVEKLARLERFWKQLDPTPHTERNEAFEEYYARIDYADKNFKAYSEGWRSDKGHCYVVYGPPNNVERTNRSMTDNRTYEQWDYNNLNRAFIFVDVSGFGDFRFYSPKMIVDKYEYDR